MANIGGITRLFGFSWERVIGRLKFGNMMVILACCMLWGCPRALHYPPLDRLLFYNSNSRFINSTNEDLVVTLMGGSERSGRWPLRCAPTGWKFRTNHFPIKSGDEAEFDYLAGFMSNISPDCWVVEDSKGNFYKVEYYRWATEVDELSGSWPASPDTIRDRYRPIAPIPDYGDVNPLIALMLVSIQVILILVHRHLRRRSSEINKREGNHAAMDPRG
ncbi:MAG: hypothetical protein O7H41_13495 [Planctomycetota bacterium]|nr:hypothetical protein [Planctomycetota bacterium]